MVPKFETAVTKHLSPRGITVARWLGGTRASANLLLLSTTPTPTLLYVKESVSAPGFWGLTKNQLDRLRASNQPWFGVFLHRSASTGYVLSGDQIGKRIRENRLRLAGDGDYKVNEFDQFMPANRFERLEELLPVLVQPATA